PPRVEINPGDRRPPAGEVLKHRRAAGIKIGYPVQRLFATDPDQIFPVQTEVSIEVRPLGSPVERQVFRTTEAGEEKRGQLQDFKQALKGSFSARRDRFDKQIAREEFVLTPPFILEADQDAEPVPALRVERLRVGAVVRSKGDLAPGSAILAEAIQKRLVG